MTCHFALFLVALAAFPFDLAAAGTVLQVPVGARAVGMGGAYSALADDASAFFWNPAGLASIGHQEIHGAHADLFGSGIKDDYLAFVLPLGPRQTLGVDWYHSGFDDRELDFGENRIGVAFSHRVARFLSIGTTLKYLNRSTALDGEGVRRGNGVGADVGFLVEPSRGLRLSAVAQDLLDTNVSYTDGDGTAVAYPMTIRFGAAFTPRSWASVTADVDDRFSSGEGWSICVNS